MTEYTINDETAISATADDDELHVYDTSAKAVYKITLAQIRAHAASGVVALTADDALTAAEHAGRTVTLGSATGDTVTLPAATGTGNVYTVVIATTVSSNNHIIQAASASDSFVGLCFGVDTDVEGATGYTWNADANDDTITMNGTATGGVAGDKWVITDIATGIFSVIGYITQSGGSEATPFSAAVS